MSRNLSLVDQYLHWALVPLCQELHPEREVVIIEVYPKRGTVITRTVKLEENHTRAENAIDVALTSLTGPKFSKSKLINYLRGVQKQFAGKREMGLC